MPSRVTFRLEDVCFVHWPADPESLSAHLPEAVAPAVSNESAWLTVVGSKSRPRDLPERQAYGQLIVRTYVTPDPSGNNDAVGPHVFVLDVVVDSAFAAVGGATLLGLPTRYGRVSVERTTSGVRVSYSRLLGGGFDATLTPEGTPEHTPSGSLAHWLVERDEYRRTDGGVDHVEHEPWLIQSASGEVVDDAVAHSFAEPTGDPMFHYSPGVILRA